MKTAYNIVSLALTNYQNKYRDAVNSGTTINDSLSVSDFLVEAAFQTYGKNPASATAKALRTVAKFADVLTPDVYVDDAIAALQKAKRALR